MKNEMNKKNIPTSSAPCLLFWYCVRGGMRRVEIKAAAKDIFS